MKEARPIVHRLGTTCGREAYPRGGKVLCPACRARPSFPEGLPWNGRHLGRCGSPSPSRGKARGGSAGQPACASRVGGRGGLGKGARAPGGAGLSSRRIHELATEGVRAKRIGITASPPRGPHGSSSYLVACPAKADLVLPRGSSAGVTTARKPTPQVTPSREAQTSLDTRPPGSKPIQGCARGSNGSQNRRSGSNKRVAFDEAASGGGPGASSLGGESNPVNPKEGARQRASEAGSRPPRSADNAEAKEHRSRGLRSQVLRDERAWLPGRPGTIVDTMPKLGARRQAALHSIMRSAKVSAGRAAWKLPPPVKAERGGDSRACRCMECSCCKVGCRRWVDASSQAGEAGREARDAGQGQLDAAVLGRRRGSIRGG